MRMPRLRALWFASLASLLTAPAVQPATIAFDGGITLWISWDNLDAADGALDDDIAEGNGPAGSANCDPTNGARSDLGAPNSPPSCPAAGSCSGRDKMEVDLQRLADYICTSTEGAHYLRRVYVSDRGRGWDSADVTWNVGSGGSVAWPGGWADPTLQTTMRSAYRTCIHDVVHHELGHYVYDLPDRYARSGDYYYGTIDGGAAFQVDVIERDQNTVMASNFPHLFVDTTNARIVVDYNPPGPGTVSGEVLTPALLTDADSDNDGPDRAHHGFTNPFAQDEWSLIPLEHVDLIGVHTEGSFPAAGACPDPELVFIGDDEPHPGRVLLLDRSGSMGVTTNGIPAAQFVQEAGMFLYHSSEPDDIVGTYLYNAAVEELFPYDDYDPANDLPFAAFRNASGATNIAAALELAIDELIARHGEGGANGGEIYLMSDGRQTTGPSLWDQVDRADGLGIRIHTFSFGDADTTTMTDIAGGASGTTTPLSEREDAAELKMIMSRKFATSLGRTPVLTFKGVMRERINLGATSVFPGFFDVPPQSREVLFYTFLHAGNASQEVQIRLEDPSGNVFVSPAPDNVVSKGRFNGVRVPRPEAGRWKYLLAGAPGKPLPSEDIEITAYVDNHHLRARAWWEGFGNLRAQVALRYPLSKVTAYATFYVGGQPVHKVRMWDDGETGGDEAAFDGVYSARVDYGREKWDKLLSPVNTQSRKLRVEVDFEVTENSVPAPRTHYETGFTFDQALADYKSFRSDFHAGATTVLNLAARGREEKERPRITRVEPDDPVKVGAGGGGRLVFTIANAQPLVGQLRVSLGQGIEVEVEVEPDEARDPKQPTYKGDSRQAGATFVVEYAVAKNAKPGARDLVAQFGDRRVTSEKVLYVSD